MVPWGIGADPGALRKKKSVMQIRRVTVNAKYSLSHGRGDIWGTLKYHLGDYSSLTSLCYKLTNFKVIRSNRDFTIVGLKDLYLLSVTQ